MKLQKLCLYKIFNIDSTTKVNCHEFTILYSIQNVHNPGVAKDYLSHNFLIRSNFAFVSFQKKKVFHLKKCLCHVYVYAMALT